jgi:hypothetical protein
MRPILRQAQQSLLIEASDFATSESVLNGRYALFMAVTFLVHQPDRAGLVISGPLAQRLHNGQWKEVAGVAK